MGPGVWRFLWVPDSWVQPGVWGSMCICDHVCANVQLFVSLHLSLNWCQLCWLISSRRFLITGTRECVLQSISGHPNQWGQQSVSWAGSWSTNISSGVCRLALRAYSLFCLCVPLHRNWEGDVVITSGQSHCLSLQLEGPQNPSLSPRSVGLCPGWVGGEGTWSIVHTSLHPLSSTEFSCALRKKH